MKRDVCYWDQLVEDHIQDITMCGISNVMPQYLAQHVWVMAIKASRLIKQKILKTVFSLLQKFVIIFLTLEYILNCNQKGPAKYKCSDILHGVVLGIYVIGENV